MDADRSHDRLISDLTADLKPVRRDLGVEHPVSLDRAEVARKRQGLVGRQALLREDQHQVVEPGFVDRPHRLRIGLFAQIGLIGTSPLALSIWQTALLISILFHHSNVELPLAVERRLSRVFVTPRMHGIHHSIVHDETDSNWSSGL